MQTRPATAVAVVVATIVAVVGTTAPTLADDVEGRIRAGAEASLQAMMNNDYEALLDLSYPRIIELMGGRDNMTQMLRSAGEQIKEAGIEFQGMNIKKVSPPVQAGAEKHAVVNLSLTMKSPEGTVRQHTYFIAVSADDGVTWTFVDGAQMTPQSLELLFPDFNDELVLPVVPEPETLAEP